MFVLHRLAGGRFSPKVVLRWTKKALAYFFFYGYSISVSIFSLRKLFQSYFATFDNECFGFFFFCRYNMSLKMYPDQLSDFEQREVCFHFLQVKDISRYTFSGRIKSTTPFNLIVKIFPGKEKTQNTVLKQAQQMAIFFYQLMQYAQIVS